MKFFLAAGAAALLLCACSSTPETTPADAAAPRVDCRGVDAPTGSRLVRKKDCPVAEAAGESTKAN